MLSVKYKVIGDFKRPRKDHNGETQDCENYSEALRVKAEWLRSKKYKDVYIVRNEEAKNEWKYLR